MFDSVQGLLDEHDAIQAQLGDPAVYADQKLARKLGRRSAQLNGIVEAYHKWEGLRDDLAAAKEMAAAAAGRAESSWRTSRSSRTRTSRSRASLEPDGV